MRRGCFTQSMPERHAALVATHHPPPALFSCCASVMALPHFLIIGAMKAGTTSLFMDMSANPAVFIPAEKEPHCLCEDRVLTPRGAAGVRGDLRGCPPRSTLRRRLHRLQQAVDPPGRGSAGGGGAGPGDAGDLPGEKSDRPDHQPSPPRIHRWRGGAGYRCGGTGGSPLCRLQPLWVATRTVAGIIWERSGCGWCGSRITSPIGWGW